MDLKTAIQTLCDNSDTASSEEKDAVLDWAKDIGSKAEVSLSVDKNTLKDVAHLMIHIFDITAPPEDMLLKLAMHQSQVHMASLLYSAALLSVALLGYQPPDLAAALFKGLGIGNDDPPYNADTNPLD